MTRIVFSMPVSRSRMLLLYLIVSHSVMLVALLNLLAVSLWSVLVTLMITLSFVYYCRQNQWLKSKSLMFKIERGADELWHLQYGDDKQNSKLTLTGSVVTPQVTILYFNGKQFWQRYAITIVADAVDAELFRQLRVYCRDPKTFQQ